MEPNFIFSPSDRIIKPLTKSAKFLSFLILLLVSCAPPATLVKKTGISTEPVSSFADTNDTREPIDPFEDLAPTARAKDQDEGDPDRLYPTLPGGLERIGGTQHASETGEVSAELLENILEDISGRRGIDHQQIEVVRAEVVIWPDGSLGCPKLGEYYTQKPVKGYWIILEIEKTAYDYRVSDQGFLFLCERPLPQSLPDQPDQ